MIAVATNESIEIQCKDCQKTFEFSVTDQAFFAEHNYHVPQRCQPCRLERRKRDERRNQIYGLCDNCGAKELLDAVTGFCSKCITPHVY